MTEDRVGQWLMGTDFAIAESGREYERTVDHGAAASGPGTYARGGYTLDAAAAGDMLGQAKEALEELRTLKIDVQKLKAVQPPAKDPASVAYNARLASGSGVFDHGVAHIDTEIEYLVELIGKIEEAFAKTQGQEHIATESIKDKASQQPGSNRHGSSEGGSAG
ncbi:hypothetical protein [Amycolatopsis oliviviridis]|uniref:hypothetical protein n=1 Tax=Amycolatopsis oliviviridis TaxID=1471590 RepID=UPI00174ABA25|nr:hypothetical protein [Amycolatopsis oliviviridis]